MKKKNGFTLIELLAVIVILAIISLIATPIVLNLLERARKGAALRSTEGIIKASQNYIGVFMLQNYGAFPDDVLFECSKTGCVLNSELDSYDIENLDKLEFNGTLPTSGTIKISGGGQEITTTNLVINNYVCGYINGRSECIKKSDEVKENGTIVYFNPETGKQCENYVANNSDTDNTKGCLKWYIYNDSNDSMVYHLLLDHNTTGITMWNSQNNNRDASEINAKLKEDTKGWQDNLMTRLITADEIAQITKNDKFDFKDGDTWFFFQDFSHDYPATLDCAASQSCTYAWLYDRTNFECETYGCSNASNVEVWSYWTSSPVASDFTNVWSVNFNGGIGSNYPSNQPAPGIRPVITISKTTFNKI